MIQIDHDAGEEMRELLQVPRERRDESWQQRFDEVLMLAPFIAGDVMEGPDGFAYLVLRSAERGADVTTLTSLPAVARDATERGYGVVLDPDEQGAPTWVLHYGQLWSLREYRSFRGDPEDEPAAGGGAEQAAGDRRITVGQPNERMFPAYARRVVATYLKRVVGIAEPEVLVMIDPAARPARNLVFNLHPEDFPDQAALQMALQSLMWFLPPNRGVVAVSRNAGFEDAFAPLTAAGLQPPGTLTP